MSEGGGGGELEPQGGKEEMGRLDRASLNPFPQPQEKADLGELNFSLCYLPTAGRLTVTIIKASNLKAMDLTGFSGAFPGGAGVGGRRMLGPDCPV